MLRSELDAFFSAKLDPRPSRPPLRPVVCVDECLNHPHVAAPLFALYKDGVISHLSPAWYEQRLASDGVVAHVSNLRLPGLPSLVGFFGKPIPGASWPDEQVMWVVVSQFLASDTVYFLSENVRRDVRGIRRLLEQYLRPMLENSQRKEYRLVTLWKKPRTTYAAYAAQVTQMIRINLPANGYSALFL